MGKAKTSTTARRKGHLPAVKKTREENTPSEAISEVPRKKLEREDQLVLQLAMSEMQNKELQVRMANQTFQESQATFNKHLNSINLKYGLNPEKDKIDLATGLIQKG